MGEICYGVTLYIHALAHSAVEFYPYQLCLFLLEMDSEEKERLLKEIQSLKDEMASMKSSSLLGDHQPKDIVRKCHREGRRERGF